MIEWVDQPPGIPSRDDLVRAACLGDTHIDHDTVQTLVVTSRYGESIPLRCSATASC